jgi:hypothetical protein
MSTYSGALKRTFVVSVVDHTPSGGGVNGVVIATAQPNTYVDVDMRTFQGQGGPTSAFLTYWDIQKKINGQWYGIEVVNGADVAFTGASESSIGSAVGLSAGSGAPVLFPKVPTTDTKWRHSETELKKAPDFFQPIRLGPDERLVLATQLGTGTMRIQYATITYSSSL